MDKEAFFVSAVALALAMCALIIYHLFRREGRRPVQVYPTAEVVVQMPTAPTAIFAEEVTECSTIWEEREEDSDEELQEEWDVELALAETKEEPLKMVETRFH